MPRQLDPSQIVYNNASVPSDSMVELIQEASLGISRNVASWVDTIWAAQ